MNDLINLLAGILIGFSIAVIIFGIIYLKEIKEDATCVTDEVKE